jgi:UDP-glucose 4-epimerase
MRRAMAGVDTVVHLASKAIDTDGSGFESINVEGARNVLTAAHAAGVHRFLYVSTAGVYGHGTHRLTDETQTPAPDTPFSRSKAAAEEVVLTAHRRGELETVILRNRFVYGVGDEHFVPRILAGVRRFPIWLSRGKARMSLIFADDFAQVVWRLVSESWPRAEPEPIYNVTSGESPSFRRLVTILGEVLGCPSPRLSIPLPLLYWPVRWREILLRIDPETTASSISSLRLALVGRDNTFSNAKLVEHLGHLEVTPLAEGIRQSRSFYRRFV